MRRLAAVLLAALGASCGGPDAPGEVRVFAASSLTDVMKTIAAEFEKDTGAKVKLNLASSSVLAKQIVEGARCDVFLSADQEWADFVEKAGLVEPGTRRDLLTNRMVLVLRSSEVDTHSPLGWSGSRSAYVGEILKSDAVRRVAIGDPAHVPAGRYARTLLDAYGQWESVQGKLVLCETVRAALALVERGEADAGIVYATDALASKAKIVTVEYDGGRARARQPLVRYPVMRISASSEGAKRFDLHLDSTEARQVFERAGFGVPSPPK